MTAQEKLRSKNDDGKFVCVGLDSDINKVPDHLKSEKNPILTFNKKLIEATHSETAAYKLNFAFYEKEGLEGIKTLKETIEFIPKEILIIGDAKRGDIGNTSKMYASSLFEYFKVDASTLHAYMGEDSISPFLEYEEKLNFILALTSNPGSQDFEKLKLENGNYLFQEVIKKVQSWNENKNCGIVFGATNETELDENIELINDLPVLLPGIGAQGGDLNSVVNTFKNSGRKDFLINVSRGIIYKSREKDFDQAAADELEKLNDQINKIIFE